MMTFANEDKYNGGWYQGKKSGTGTYLVINYSYHLSFDSIAMVIAILESGMTDIKMGKESINMRMPRLMMGCGKMTK